MALTASFILLSCYLALSARCVPLDANPSPSSVQYVIVTQVVTSQAEVLETSTVLGSSSTASYSSSTTIASQQPSTITPSSAFTPSPQTTTSVVTVVETVTPPPVTVTVSEAPSTTTQTVTVTPTSSSSEAAKTAWAASAQITDLSSFNVSEFAYGQHNMQIVNGIPADASATTPTVLTVATAAIENVDGTPPAPILSPTWDNSSAVIQLLYPAGSINPESEPQGGADFYASPLDIKNATNVTMEYSVFFPQDFDWVLAGKLPGIYGGHTTCSGGDDATQCFKMYQYAPKDKQTDSLCSAPPISVCDEDYGLSIGRGAFNFTPGAWTHVQQTVGLNTPGQQDGSFILSVDGQEVMRRTDVFYRDVPPPTPPPEDDSPSEDTPISSDGPSPSAVSPAEPTEAPSPAPAPAAAPAAPPSAPAQQPPAAIPGIGGVVGILGPLLGPLGGLVGRDERKRHPFDLRLDVRPGSFVLEDVPAVQTTATAAAAEQAMEQVSTVTATVTVTQTVMAAPTPDALEQVQAEGVTHVSKPVGFTGLFFSSFFGGHEERYASPRDQYAWFKDFSMSVND
ncbi:hypothetical protein EIP86_001923 [Pleurotus ostreatoroseus]|nr:hypothetical protein EIP86_001923 [Pleurotus ostreatoroseus]